VCARADQLWEIKEGKKELSRGARAIKKRGFFLLCSLPLLLVVRALPFRLKFFVIFWSRQHKKGQFVTYRTEKNFASAFTLSL
jgi:hypothetical protein